MTIKHLAFALFCAAGVLLLPFTVPLAVVSAIGGDRAMLRMLRGRRPDATP